MALTITHATTVAAADDGTSEIGVDEWHQAHTFTGTLSSTQLDLAMTPTWTGAHTFSASVTGSTTVSAVKFTVTSTTTASAVSIINSTSQTAAYTLKLPVDDGTASQFLQTDGSGVTSWATPSASIAPLTITSTSVVQQQDSTVAQTLRVYNTTDSTGGSPTNYERGVFDWSTASNTLTIGTQSGGTGTQRNLSLTAGSANLTLAAATSGFTGMYFQTGGANKLFIGHATSNSIGIAGNFVLYWSTAGANADGSAVIGIGRNADGVLEINNGTAGTYRDLKGRAATLGTTSGHVGALTVTSSSTNGTAVIFASLPTTNPGVAGQLWNNANVVNVSTG